MITSKEKEFLYHLYNNSNNYIFKSYDTEFIKENLQIISELENKGFIKKSCDDFYNALAIVILPEAYKIIKNNSKEH